MRDSLAAPAEADDVQSGPTLLAAQALRVERAGRRLLDDVDAAIGQGRRTVIMGSNGAGKSLLLRVLHGLVQPSAGRVLWHGGPLNAAARRAQTMVFQRPVMLRRSVLANLRFALGVRGFRGRERAEREQAALAQARLEHVANRPARVLSGGEQQRLAIVRALACSPEALLLDEPTASLDPASTLAIEELILDAHKAGVTIVLVTHDLGQARRLGEDLVFMHDGRIAETGSARDLLNAPRSDALAAWLDGRIYLGP